MPNDFWIQCHQVSESEKETTYQLSVRLKHICSKSNVVSQLREKVSYETLSPRQHNIWWDQPIKMGHISHFQNTILPKKISIACLFLFHSESNFRNSPSFSLKSNLKNSSYQQNKKNLKNSPSLSHIPLPMSPTPPGNHSDSARHMFSLHQPPSLKGQKIHKALPILLSPCFPLT